MIIYPNHFLYSFIIKTSLIFILDLFYFGYNKIKKYGLIMIYSCFIKQGYA